MAFGRHFIIGTRSVTGALAFLAGVLLGLLSADVPTLLWQLAAAGLVTACALSSWRRQPWASACAWMLAGQVLAWSQAQQWRERLLDPGARVLAEGLIESIPERDGASLRFDLRTEHLQGANDSGVPRLLRVQWRDPPVEPRVGERWRLLIKLQPLEETCNFAGPDVARFAFRQGVHGVGRVLPSALDELVQLAPAGLDTLRARIASRVRESIADPDAAALVSALAVGLTSGMSRDQWRVFNATGTTHLVAISGLHITMFAWLAFRLSRWAWNRAPLRTIAREPFALLLGLAAAGGYSLLAGLSVPTLRTWLMLALYVAARLMSRQVGPGRLWAVALVVVLVTDVRAPLAAGFWLSFIAVGVLLAFAGDRDEHDEGKGRGGGWREALRVQLMVMLALIPASLAIFGGLSLVGLAVNLVAIPLISLVFVPVVLAGALAAWLAPAFDGPLFAVAAGLYERLWPAMVWCADVESIPALWRASPPAWWFVLALPASLVWLCRCAWPLRLTATCALLPLIFPAENSPRPGRALIDVFDAGRGSAVLVRTRTHTLLFDTGDSWNTHGARLAGIVLPALDAAQIQRVDRLLLPTLDEDRAHGAALLAAERGLAEVWSVSAWPGNAMARRCRDAEWTWDGVLFESRMQGRHCLLRVSAGRVALLIPGDLDLAGEQALLARDAAPLTSEAVVIGRQASEMASSPRWIEGIAPGLAIATGGIDGAQSRQRVLQRWGRVARIVDTRRDGGVQLRLDDQGVDVLATARPGRFPFHWRRPV